MKQLIEVKDVVKFVDGSYTLSLINGVMKKTPLGNSKAHFIVVAINVPLPTCGSNIDVLAVANNCIVFNPIDDSYHFCSHINIQNVN